MLGDINNSRKSGILKGAATRNPYHMPNIEGCRSVYKERGDNDKTKRQKLEPGSIWDGYQSRNE